ncbi:hypothetical protein BDR26DRAFT_869568, partial [Obelidium mucronatum]
YPRSSTVLQSCLSLCLLRLPLSPTAFALLVIATQAAICQDSIQPILQIYFWYISFPHFTTSQNFSIEMKKPVVCFFSLWWDNVQQTQTPKKKTDSLLLLGARLERQQTATSPTTILCLKKKRCLKSGLQEAKCNSRQLAAKNT